MNLCCGNCLQNRKIILFFNGPNLTIGKMNEGNCSPAELINPAGMFGVTRRPPRFKSSEVLHIALLTCQNQCCQVLMKEWTDNRLLFPFLIPFPCSSD